jgi:hypothetical protein
MTGVIKIRLVAEYPFDSVREYDAQFRRNVHLLHPERNDRFTWAFLNPAIVMQHERHFHFGLDAADPVEVDVRFALWIP